MALIAAVECGDLSEVNRLLDLGVDTQADIDTALHRAAHCGHFNVVNRLLNAGADVHAFNDSTLKIAIASI